MGCVCQSVHMCLCVLSEWELLLKRRLQARVATQQEELVEMRKKFERSRGDLKQRTVDVHMLQVISVLNSA